MSLSSDWTCRLTLHILAATNKRDGRGRSMSMLGVLPPLAGGLAVLSLVLAAALAALVSRQRSERQAEAQRLEALHAEWQQAQRAGHEQQAAAQVAKAQAQQWQRQVEELRGELAAQRQQAQEMQRALLESRGQADAAGAQLAQWERQCQGLEETNRGLLAAQEQLRQQHADLAREHATLVSTLEQRERHFAEQHAMLQDSREHLKREFEQLAGRIFEARGSALSQQSQQSLDALLRPFREQIEGFRHKVEDLHHKDTQQQAALLQELSHLKELNRQITQEAHELATALKGQKKAQGNWGELVLENVLERSGLVAGRDFRREVSFAAEEGRRRPDAIVYLPQGKHLIIDAKVSLNAYTRYVNAEEEGERRLALAEHVAAVSARIRELAERNYHSLPGLRAPEMVFMFVPIESAFVEALKADETLFQRAIERNVLVATPTTLLTSLNIVRQLWRFEDQNRHTAELAERASRVYDKLRTFLGSMDALGAGLDRAQDAYRKACDQLVSGKGNLVRQVSDFRELGVAVKGEIGEHWAERATLELGVAGEAAGGPEA